MAKIPRKIDPRFLIERNRRDLPSTPEEIFEKRELYQLTQKVLVRLPARQQKVIQGIYFDGKSLNEVGKEMGFSKVRAAQLRDKALARLRRRLLPKCRRPSHIAH